MLLYIIVSYVQNIYLISIFDIIKFSSSCRDILRLPGPIDAKTNCYVFLLSFIPKHLHDYEHMHITEKQGHINMSVCTIYKGL